MSKPKRSRSIWALCAALAIPLLVGLGFLFTRLKPYWVARYHGKGADLHAARLAFAPLAGAALDGANLRGASLRGANLSRASLGVDPNGPPFPFMPGGLRERRGTDLTHADLTRANLKGAWMGDARLSGP